MEMLALSSSPEGLEKVELDVQTFFSHHATPAYVVWQEHEFEEEPIMKIFVCGNGEQIPADYECDGDVDCDDGSDEIGCPNYAQLICP